MLWLPSLGELLLICKKISSSKGAFLVGENMKITKFYIDNARYKAIDDSGGIIWIDIDYWENNFELSEPNKRLENLAKELLERKHKVNFVSKLVK